MAAKVQTEKFEAAVTSIRREFPDLAIDVCFDHHALDAVADIKQQSGLRFDLSINLQNVDELHLNAGAPQFSWFPCTRDEVHAQFIEAITGLLSGKFRIVEYRLGRWTAEAQLQRPRADGWETIATYTTPLNLVPWWRSTRVVQNADAA